MIVYYDLESGAIRATIEHNNKTPGEPQEGLGVLTVDDKYRRMILNHKVDVGTGKLVPKSEEDLKAEREEAQKALDEQKRMFEQQDNLNARIKALEDMLKKRG